MMPWPWLAKAGTPHGSGRDSGKCFENPTGEAIGIDHGSLSTLSATALFHDGASFGDKIGAWRFLLISATAQIISDGLN